MKLQLVGVYGDGSNARHLRENILLERQVIIGEGADGDEQQKAVDELFSAREACQKTCGSYSDYIIILEPDD